MKPTNRHYPGGKFDYRKALVDVIDGAVYDAHQAGTHLTHRMIAQRSEMTGPALSNVLNKRKNLSLKQLEKVLAVLGHRLTFEVDPNAGVTNKEEE